MKEKLTDVKGAGTLVCNRRLYEISKIILQLAENESSQR